MRILMLILTASLFWTGAAWAGGSMSPQEAAASTGANECPVLTQAKYPFLSCTTSATGGKVLAVSPDVANDVEGRQMPLGFEFTESRGHFPESWAERRIEWGR